MASRGPGEVVAVEENSFLTEVISRQVVARNGESDPVSALRARAVHDRWCRKPERFRCGEEPGQCAVRIEQLSCRTIDCPCADLIDFSGMTFQYFCARGNLRD
jgi:hypothetical protein